MGKHHRISRENAGHSGLEQALLKLYRATYREARRLGLPPEDCKDAAMGEVEDCFEALVQSAERATEREAGAVSLLSKEEIGRRASAAASRADGKYRREMNHRVGRCNRDAEAVAGVDDIADPRPSPQEEVQQRAFLAAIVDSVADLPGEAGTQFLAHHIGQESWADLARLHGCTPEAMRQRLLRALAVIREALARLGWDETGSG